MDTALLEEPAAQHAGHPATTLGAHPGLEFEPARRAWIEVLRRLVFQRLEGDDQPVAQFLEPGRGPLEGVGRAQSISFRVR